MSEPTKMLLRDLEAHVAWALAMAWLSGLVIGAALASAVLGQLACGG